MSPEADRQTERRRGRLRRDGPAVGVSCAGLALTLCAYAALARLDKQRVSSEFARLAEHRTNGVEHAVADRIAALEAFRTVFRVVPAVGRDDFAELVRPHLACTPDVLAIIWAPRVTADTRRGFELRAREDGMERFQVVCRTADGRVVRAGCREDCFPAYYVEPYLGNEGRLGLDLARRPEAKEAMDRARDTGQLVLAAPRPVTVPRGVKLPAVAAFLPVYEPDSVSFTPEGRRENLRGFLVGLYVPVDIAAAALGPVGRRTIDVCLYDVTDAEVVSLCGAACPAAGEGDGCEGAGRRRHRHLNGLGRTLLVGGRRYRVCCAPSANFTETRASASPVWALTVGLICSALLGVYVQGARSRNERTREAVARRTAELREEVRRRHRAQAELRQAKEQLEQANRQRAEALCRCGCTTASPPGET